MSLRMRLIISYTVIIVLCLLMVALTVTAILQGYRDRFVKARLDDMALPIYIQARSLARTQASVGEVWASLVEQSQNTGIHIFLTDSQGNIMRQAVPQPNLRQKVIKLPPGELPTDITKAFHGTFETVTGQTFIYAAYPFDRLFSLQRRSNLEAVVFAMPRSGALTILMSLIRPFMWAGLIAFGVSVIIALLLARSVYKPIQRVTEAAGKIAQGQYDQEIPVAGPAEVRGLAVSFNQMARQVKLSQKRLRDFVADVSHQLKSPLTSIMGFAQAILDGTASDDNTQKKAAQVIENESMRMIRQVDELLELSRMQSGQVQMACESVDVKGLIEHCREIFAMSVEEKGVTLKIDIELSLTVSGDIDRLEQVFSNLLDNALKHSPDGSEINVTGRRINAESVEVAVADNGPGIPSEQLPHVFARFYQAGEVRTGVGLGLAIAREIVLAHRGEIDVSSVPGEGTKFIVRLPAGAAKLSQICG